MPGRYRIALALDDAARVSAQQLHGLISGWIDEDHRAGSKPFSIGPLWVDAAGRLNCEVGVLRDHLGERLRLSVEAAPGGGRDHLGGQTARAAPGGEGFAVLRWASWEDLCNVPPRRTVTFWFVTPTHFAWRKAESLIPDPRTLFEGLARRWRGHGPTAVGHELDLASDAVLPVDFELRTERMVVGHSMEFGGFVGRMTVGLVVGAGENPAVLARLAALSEFCGVGARTTLGLGVVRCDPG